MKFYSLFFVFVFLFTTAAEAKNSESYVQGVLGFESGAVNIGFDFESREANSKSGFGGYFIYSDEEEGVSSQVLSFGVMSKVHIFENNTVDISLGPGFGLSMIENGNNDETTFGPILKIGLLYKFSAKVAFGGEIFKAYNWLSDEAEGNFEYFNLALRLKL